VGCLKSVRDHIQLALSLADGVEYEPGVAGVGDRRGQTLQRSSL